MKKRHSIMVSEEVYKALKRVRAQLLVNEDMEFKSLGEVILFLVKDFDSRRGGECGNKKVS